MIDRPAGQHRCKRFLAILRIFPRTGESAHVGDCPDAGSFEQADKLLERTR